MLLLLFAVLGLFLGNQFGMTRRGFLILISVFIGATVLQVAHLVSAIDRSSMTLLPLIFGIVLAASMFLGAIARRPVAGN